ncbi:hypothetical protein RHMOL_Rhmol12G0194400 [Rhododendron molle]|uniref:Uncharacterized protein n=1 Tax=Rhododendron molle TaxID=49168 RepID=A0ACC0LK86_RHOML|nr:hypothetical protein RHMOL_Rhmol12G0194400 [Rhododendron molle]
MAMGTGRGRGVLPPPPTHYPLPHPHPRPDPQRGFVFFLHPRPKRGTGIQNGDSGIRALVIHCFSKYYQFSAHNN